jgi:hypothetical protein
MYVKRWMGFYDLGVSPINLMAERGFQPVLMLN